MAQRGSPRILVLDPNPHDSTAVGLALRQHHSAPNILICKDLAEFAENVERAASSGKTHPAPDVVVCAHRGRGRRSEHVLESLRRAGIDAPAVVLLDPDYRSESPPDDLEGVIDFVVKDRVGRYLDRLPHLLDGIVARVGRVSDEDPPDEQEKTPPGMVEPPADQDPEWQDLPHREHLEQELRRVRAWLTALVEHSPAGVALELEDGRIGITNGRLCELLGLVEPPRELAGRMWRDVVEGSLVLFRDPEHVTRRIDSLRSGSDEVSGETWRLADGRTFEVDSSPILRGGLPRGRQWVIRDVTRRQRREKALRWAARMEATATLAGGIAHDFNNLMVAVLGNAELLAELHPGNREAHRMLDQIAWAARRAGELSRQMLAYARGGRYRPRLLCLDETVRSVVRAQDMADPERIRIDVDTVPSLHPVLADSEQMAMVAMSLLANAVEATESGSIRMSTINREVGSQGVKGLPTMRPGDYVVLSVRDSGCGMDPDTLARVFEPFFSTKFKGRGLGLAAVYGIVKNHGGYILADSKAGKGTIVQVYFPAHVGSGIDVEPGETGERGETGY